MAAPMKEKLVELLTEPLSVVESDLGDELAPKMQMGTIFAEKVADHLIDNGVTVVSPDETRNVYTVQEIEKIQGEAYDLGVESVLHNHFNLSWHDAEEVRKEVAKLQNALRWIPVTERLPEESGEYLAYCGEYDGICVIYYEILKTKSKWMTNWKKVTHWMPLPEPPKEVE
jgi:hypothetical protein